VPRTLWGLGSSRRPKNGPDSAAAERPPMWACISLGTVSALPVGLREHTRLHGGGRVDDPGIERVSRFRVDCWLRAFQAPAETRPCLTSLDTEERKTAIYAPSDYDHLFRQEGRKLASLRPPRLEHRAHKPHNHTAAGSARCGRVSLWGPSPPRRGTPRAATRSRGWLPLPGASARRQIARDRASRVAILPLTSPHAV
jgi:hypothetical protein